MNKTYLITLTPVGKFFFGGDMNFTVNGKDTDFTSYIICSNKFPQQTSLLGMLRFLVLRNDKDVFDSSSQTINCRDGAIDLIGAKSFEKSGIVGNYGVIKNISPCFVQAKKEDGKWIPLSLTPKNANLKVDFSNHTKAVLNGVEVDIPQMDYDPKKECGLSYSYIGCDKPIKEGDIFIEDISNGINRDIHTGKTDDNALFKQVSYRLKEGFRFAFYAEVDLDKIIEYSGQVVSVGADNSQFVLGISECEKQKEDDTKGNVVTLLSPAYLTEEEIKSVRFAITDAIAFRCMKTETKNVESYNKRSKIYGYSEKLYLYATGSAFYFKSESDALTFAEKLKAHADFYQIGYNHYQVTNLTTNK